MPVVIQPLFNYNSISVSSHLNKQEKEQQKALDNTALCNGVTSPLKSLPSSSQGDNRQDL